MTNYGIFLLMDNAGFISSAVVIVSLFDSKYSTSQHPSLDIQAALLHPHGSLKASLLVAVNRNLSLGTSCQSLNPLDSKEVLGRPLQGDPLDPTSGSLKWDLIQRVFVPKGPPYPNSYEFSVIGCSRQGEPEKLEFRFFRILYFHI